MANITYSALSPCYVQAGINANVTGPTTSSSKGFVAAQGGTAESVKKTYTNGSGAGQVGIVCDLLETFVASGSVTISLQNLTEVLGTAAQSLTKVKAWLFELLNTTDDTTNGTNCSSVTFSGGTSNPNTLSLAGTSPTYTIAGGGGWEHYDISAAGITVSGTVMNIKFANNDSGNAAAMRLQILGF